VGDPSGGGSLSFEQSFERILALQTDLGTANNQGLFVPLPTKSPSQSNDASRIRTICDRLYKLGYMEKKSREPKIDTDLRKGLKVFQEEAGLKVDGWAGEKETWPALQELVSFETPTHANKWFNSSGKPRPALKRAVALRLFALGIKKTKPKSAKVRVKGDMAQFGRFWKMLNLGQTTVPVGINPEWVERLFDLDGLSDRLSNADQNLSVAKRRQVQSLILNTAKIELWLHGYGVKPDGYDLKTPRQPKGGSSDGDLTDHDIYQATDDPYLLHHIRIKNRRFYDALQQFWRDQGKEDSQADNLSIFFFHDFQSFFKAVDEGVREEKKWDPEDAHKEIEKFIKKRRKELPGIWDRVKNLGACVWDGIRRVWGWFRKIIQKGVEKVLEVGRNMSRLVYDYTLGAFTVISNVMKSIGNTIQILVNPVMPGSDIETGRILFLRDRDMDPKVFIEANADERIIERCCNELEQETRKFSFGCRVIGTCVMLLMEVFKKGWAGYFSLVLVLVKMRGLRVRFKSLADEYKEIFWVPRSSSVC